jgi:folate-dependent tRNA-U54 methylase TrmFO/GidA
VSHADPRSYQPTNITFGIMPAPDPPDGRRLKRDERKTATSERALRALDEWMAHAEAFAREA